MVTKVPRSVSKPSIHARVTAGEGIKCASEPRCSELLLTSIDGVEEWGSGEEAKDSITIDKHEWTGSKRQQDVSRSSSCSKDIYPGLLLLVLSIVIISRFLYQGFTQRHLDTRVLSVSRQKTRQINHMFLFSRAGRCSLTIWPSASKECRAAMSGRSASLLGTSDYLQF